ncbi:MAG TPA: galactose ABC transporter substrate-binding protein [Clostridia bacterium]|nr:galactose ABC transporter substrate-binding protein [Clostridia bacterium]
MKRIISIFLLASMLCCTATGCGSRTGARNVRIGCAIYKFDDTFVTTVRNYISEAAAGKAEVEIVDSQNSQQIQNDKVDLFIAERVQALAINPVDRTAAGVMLEKAKKANIPIVFFNKEPLADDMKKWDKVYYVGAKAEESGIMQGELVANYWKTHPETDKNKDGVMQYVMLKGEPAHQDAELRTKYSVQTVQDAGIEVEKLAEDNANWDRMKGQEKMTAFLATNGDKIEVVFSNNDDMALGAIEALKAAGYFRDGRYMPVVGIDAITPALQAVKDGTLLGTVFNDGKNQGRATFNLAFALARGKPVSKETVGYDITDGKYIWVPYKKVTRNDIK